MQHWSEQDPGTQLVLPRQAKVNLHSCDAAIPTLIRKGGGCEGGVTAEDMAKDFRYDGRSPNQRRC